PRWQWRAAAVIATAALAACVAVVISLPNEGEATSVGGGTPTVSAKETPLDAAAGSAVLSNRSTERTSKPPWTIRVKFLADGELVTAGKEPTTVQREVPLAVPAAKPRLKVAAGERLSVTNRKRLAAGYASTTGNTSSSGESPRQSGVATMRRTLGSGSLSVLGRGIGGRS
ncbi:MAG: hypothetical protein AAF596_10630, partial [Planctomycetota bacterium]